MPSIGQVHWHEGLFLQPHHLQAMQRALLEQSIGERKLSYPYSYGLIDAKISADALENMLVRFDRLRVVMLHLRVNGAASPFDFSVVGVVVATYTLPNLALVATKDLPLAAAPAPPYGQTVLVEFVVPSRPPGAYRIAQIDVDYDVPRTTQLKQRATLGSPGQ